MSRLLDALKRIEDQQVPVPVVPPVPEPRPSASEQEISATTHQSTDTPEPAATDEADTSAPPVDGSAIAEQSAATNGTTCPIEASPIDACTVEESTLDFAETFSPIDGSQETVEIALGEIALGETTGIDVVTFDACAPQWHDNAPPPDSEPADQTAPSDDATTATPAATVDDNDPPDSLKSLVTDGPSDETPRVQETVAPAQEAIVAVQEATVGPSQVEDVAEPIATNQTDATQSEPFHKLAKNIVQRLSGNGPWVLAIVSAETDYENRPVLNTLAQTLSAHVDGDVLLVAEDLVADDLVAKDTNDGFRERGDSSAMPTLAWACSAEQPGWHRLSWSDIDALEVSGETVDFGQLRDELPSTVSLALLDAGTPGTRRAERCLSSCDGVYLVVRLGHTPRDAVRAARCWIAGCHCRLLGCIAQDN